MNDGDEKTKTQDIMKESKLLLIGNYLPDGQESMIRYAQWLTNGLRGRGFDVTLARAPIFFGLFCKRLVGLNKWLKYIDKYFIFPIILKLYYVRKFDHFHIMDHSNALYVKCLPSKLTSITCHDMLAIRSAYEEGFGPSTSWSGRLLQSQILSGLRSIPRVICGSSATICDLRYWTNADKNISFINYPFHGDFRVLDREKLELWKEEKGVPKKYLLHVGDNSWYKNRMGVLQIFEQFRQMASMSDIHLIMLGKPLAIDLKIFIDNHDLNQVVHHDSNVSDEDIIFYYNGANALLFPSLIEGFGWPIIEAQACGCPVITTDADPMREVSGGMGILIDPMDVTSSCLAIEKMLSANPLAKELLLDHVKKHSPEKVLNDYVDYFFPESQ